MIRWCRGGTAPRRSANGACCFLRESCRRAPVLGTLISRRIDFLSHSIIGELSSWRPRSFAILVLSSLCIGVRHCRHWPWTSFDVNTGRRRGSLRRSPGQHAGVRDQSIRRVLSERRGRVFQRNRGHHQRPGELANPNAAGVPGAGKSPPGTNRHSAQELRRSPVRTVRHAHVRRRTRADSHRGPAPRRNDPTLGDIYSGTALNSLLLAIQQQQSRNGPVKNVPLDPTVVSRINVTGGQSSASLGLLKDGGKLRWPLAPSGDDFKSGREDVDQLASAAYKQASSGTVDADTLDKMTSEVNDLEAQLRKQIEVVAPNDYMTAKRYLNDLKTTIRAPAGPERCQLRQRGVDSHRKNGRGICRSNDPQGAANRAGPTGRSGGLCRVTTGDGVVLRMAPKAMGRHGQVTGAKEILLSIFLLLLIFFLILIFLLIFVFFQHLS